MGDIGLNKLDITPNSGNNDNTPLLALEFLDTPNLDFLCDWLQNLADFATLGVVRRNYSNLLVGYRVISNLGLALE